MDSGWLIKSRQNLITLASKISLPLNEMTARRITKSYRMKEIEHISITLFWKFGSMIKMTKVRQAFGTECGCPTNLDSNVLEFNDNPSNFRMLELFKSLLTPLSRFHDNVSYTTLTYFMLLVEACCWSKYLPITSLCCYASFNFDANILVIHT